MKVLTIFPNSIEANIAKGLLESHEILVMIHDDSVNQLMPIQGVKLSVQAELIEQARAILIEHGLLTD